MKLGKLTPKLTSNIKAAVWVKEYEYNVDATYTADLCTGGAAIHGGEYYSKSPEVAFDNDTGTFWQSSQLGTAVNGGAYIGYDFGAGITKHIRKMTIDHYLSTAYIPATADFQYSDNGSDWTTVNNSSMTANLNKQTYYLAASGSHRYWRVLATADLSGGQYWSIEEVEMMECASGNPPITQLTISNLHGDTDKEYKLDCRFVNNYNGATIYGLRPNNDTGGANYGLQTLNGETTDVTAGRSADAKVTLGYASLINRVGQCNLTMFAKKGYPRTFMHFLNRDITGTTITYIQQIASVWNNTADEITSLVIYASETSGLGIGTNIILWKKVAK